MHGWPLVAGLSGDAGWRVFAVILVTFDSPLGFFLVVFKMLETSTDHFIFNVSEVQLFRFQIFKQRLVRVKLKQRVPTIHASTYKEEL